MLYLSGCISKELVNNRHPFIGIMYTPDMGNKLPEGFTWAADNACFSQGDKFNLDTFLHWLDKQTRDRCLFAVSPDVLGDAANTIRRSVPVFPKIHELGFFAAFVGQDGAEREELPWDQFDTWFIGGSTEWKLSAQSFDLVQEALERGKWVHMGRVNSMKRYQLARSWGCNSVDGTFLAYGPTKQWPRLVQWVESAQTLRMF